MITKTQPVNTHPALNQVKAAHHLVSASDLVIPQGTAGRILGYTPIGSAFVDFGALPVFLVPADSPLIEWGVKR